MRKEFVALCLGALAFGSGCRNAAAPQAKSNRVVLYCSVDDVYARPIIRDLEKQTGLKIDALYDTEAAKTAGLANRIRAEKDRPQGDVFWSSALLQTLLLKREGLLQPYVSPSAKDIPAAFKAKDGSWTGLGVRGHGLIYSWCPTISAAPGIWALRAPMVKNSIGISNPQFGTCSDWVAASATRWGEKKTLEYFRDLKQNGVHILPGNSVVAEKVARGELEAGMADTDDYYAQKAKAKGEFVFQWFDDDLVLVPGSVAILKNSPHEENAKKLVDALLRIETEQRLVNTMTGVLPTRSQIKIRHREVKSRSLVTRSIPYVSRGVMHPGIQALAGVLRAAPDDTDKWPAAWDAIREPLAELLLKD